MAAVFTNPETICLLVLEDDAGLITASLRKPRNEALIVYADVVSSRFSLWNTWTPRFTTWFLPAAAHPTATRPCPALDDFEGLPNGGNCTLKPAEDELHGSGTILVGEDEPGIRHIICGYLHFKRYGVMQASNAAEALQILADNPEPVDLLLTDMMMRGGSGPELATPIHKMGWHLLGSGPAHCMGENAPRGKDE